LPATSRRKTSSAGTVGDPPDYVSVAEQYAAQAAKDRKGQGKYLRLAAKRFLADLKRAKRRKPPFTFSRWHANDACDYIEKLPHVEGVWEKDTIKLEPAQVFFVVALFGFRRHDGTRRFTTALFAVARKNAKSTLAAGILLYCLCCEDEVGPQLLSAATTGDQARIVFNVAKRMVERMEDLREAFMLEPFKNAIARYDVGGTFKPINAKASTQDGLNPSALCFDELHAHKTRDLYDVLRSAAGARSNPLFLYTTTEGYESPGPWAEVRKFAFQVLDGVVEADHFLALYFALDDEDDDFDESKWIKANPLLGVSISMDKMREYATEAKQQPGALAEFQIKRLNRRASAAEGWIDLRRWRRCDGPVDLDALAGARCWAALDLASTNDLCAWRLLWLVDGHYYTWGRRWVPQEAVSQRTERGTTPYADWVAQGWLEQTSGNVADYDLIEKQIFSDWERFQPRVVAFDSWNAASTANRLTSQGVQMLQFIQGPKSYNPAMKALDCAYRAKKLSHGGDPVLTWCASNLVPRYGENMNMAPDKKRSADKIDDMVALIMAFGVAEADIEEDISAFLNDPIRLA
jgi:phage terminase large subunit-like protein